MIFKNFNFYFYLKECTTLNCDGKGHKLGKRKSHLTTNNCPNRADIGNLEKKFSYSQILYKLKNISAQPITENDTTATEDENIIASARENSTIAPKQLLAFVMTLTICAITHLITKLAIIEVVKIDRIFG